MEWKTWWKCTKTRCAENVQLGTYLLRSKRVVSTELWWCKCTTPLGKFIFSNPCLWFALQASSWLWSNLLGSIPMIPTVRLPLVFVHVSMFYFTCALWARDLDQGVSSLHEKCKFMVPPIRGHATKCAGGRQRPTLHVACKWSFKLDGYARSGSWATNFCNVLLQPSGSLTGYQGRNGHNQLVGVASSQNLFSWLLQPFTEEDSRHTWAKMLPTKHVRIALRLGTTFSVATVLTFYSVQRSEVFPA